MRLMLPGVFGAGATQLNLVISTAIASLLPTGAVSYLYYADRLEPASLGRRRLRGRHGDPAAAVAPGAPRRRGGRAIDTQNRGLELAFLLTLPAAVALGVAALPILEVLFERGAFGPAEARATAGALAAYAAGAARLRAGQGDGAGLFRAPRHGDAGQDRVRRHRR